MTRSHRGVRLPRPNCRPDFRPFRPHVPPVPYRCVGVSTKPGQAQLVLTAFPLTMHEYPLERSNLCAWRAPLAGLWCVRIGGTGAGPLRTTTANGGEP
jgi:hypothetical protein